MITVEAHLSYEKPVEAVGQLNADELDKLQGLIVKLQASKKKVALPKQEADLLLKINSLSALRSNPRHEELIAK